MLVIYCVFGSEVEDFYIFYFIICFDSLMFFVDWVIWFVDIVDGFFNIIMVVEVVDEVVVFWMKFDDFEFDLMKLMWFFVRIGRGGFFVILGDGLVCFFLELIGVEEFGKWMERNDG